MSFHSNLGRSARTFRILGGTLLLAWAIAGGPSWAFLGLPVIASGAWGFCPVVWLFSRQER